MAKNKIQGQDDAELSALEQKEQVKNLGKVDTDKRPPIDDKIKIAIGMHILEPEELLYDGAFYPATMMHKYRAANGGEIRHFSMVNEESPISVDDAMKQLLSSCTELHTRPGQRTSNKNIMSHDRFIFALKIREATYPAPQSRIAYKPKCSCGVVTEIPLTTNNMVKPKFNEYQTKYYDENERCFIVPTVVGTLRIQPPTIAREEIFRAWVIDMHQNNNQHDPRFAEMWWLLLNDTNQHEEGIMNKLYQQYLKMDDQKLAGYFAMAERLRIIPVEQVYSPCSSESCSREVYNKIEFPDGVRNFLVNTASVDSFFL